VASNVVSLKWKYFHCDFTNYRPISLLSSFSKLLEKLVSRQMFRFIDNYSILNSHHYGFRPKHDTSHPLLQFLDKIYQGLKKDESEYTLGVFLDLKKPMILLTLKYF